MPNIDVFSGHADTCDLRECPMWEQTAKISSFSSNNLLSAKRGGTTSITSTFFRLQQPRSDCCLILVCVMPVSATEESSCETWASVAMVFNSPYLVSVEIALSGHFTPVHQSVTSACKPVSDGASFWPLTSHFTSLQWREYIAAYQSLILSHSLPCLPCLYV